MSSLLDSMVLSFLQDNTTIVQAFWAEFLVRPILQPGLGRPILQRRHSHPSSKPFLALSSPCLHLSHPSPSIAPIWLPERAWWRRERRRARSCSRLYLPLLSPSNALIQIHKFMRGRETGAISGMIRASASRPRLLGASLTILRLLAAEDREGRAAARNIDDREAPSSATPSAILPDGIPGSKVPDASLHSSHWVHVCAGSIDQI
jgi:hypothetical protein